MPEDKPNKDAAHWNRLIQGDPDALGYFYDNYVDQLFRAALRITDNRELAKDSLQEVFIEIWHYRKTLGNVCNSQAYLIKVLRSILLKKIKKESLINHNLPEDSLVSPVQSIEESIISVDMDREKKYKLQLAVSTLTKRQKLILELRFFKGLSYDQIAEKLSMNYQSVNNLAFRTILSLRRQMFILVLVFLLF